MKYVIAIFTIAIIFSVFYGIKTDSRIKTDGVEVDGGRIYEYRHSDRIKCLVAVGSYHNEIQALSCQWL